MKSTALNVNLPKGTPVDVRAILDNDPDDAKVVYSGEVVEDGRLRIVFPECAHGACRGRVIAPGFQESDEFAFNVGETEGGSLTLIEGSNRFRSASVDPAKIPLGRLLAIRGSIFSSYFPCSQGIRPNQPDNINVLGDGLRFSTDERAAMLAAYKARGYTHVDVSFGPANQGYHNLYDSLPAIWDEPDQWADFLQWLYDNGVIPVAFLTWDNAPLDETGVLDQRYMEVLKSPRFQQLIRIAVPYGWEPNSGGKYDISNQQYCDRFAWGKSVFPEAKHFLHLATDCDAPIGGDQEPPELIEMGKPEWWRRVNVAGCDGWFDQINGWFDTGPDITDAFKANLEQRVRDISHRFKSGEWGNGSMLYYGAEYAAYNVFHQPHGDKRWNEAGAQAVGDLFMAYGARGYFDSGTVNVPDVQE